MHCASMTRSHLMHSDEKSNADALSLCLSGNNWSTLCRSLQWLHNICNGNQAEYDHRVWYTEVRYLHSGPTWEHRVQVQVNPSSIVFSTQYHGVCGSPSPTRHSCIKTHPSNTLNCVKQIHGHSYAVERSGDQHIKFKCIRFAIRSSNVVQVWFSKALDTWNSTICDDSGLARREWPWIGNYFIEPFLITFRSPQPSRIPTDNGADVPTNMRPFPRVGGYDFQAYATGKKKKLCHRVWRPSRLESECIAGEGMRIMFPEKSCSFLHERRLEMKLENWGSWKERQYTFVVAAEPNKSPHYVMRIQDPDGASALTVQFFSSPVCPLNENGTAPGVVHHTLRLQKSEAGLCVDESPRCRVYAAEGKCSNGNLHQYANFCKRSCGLCELVASKKAECDFPMMFHGKWLLFEEHRREIMRMTEGKLTFSERGEFICKAKHWEEDHYKFLSVFENGCRPRYTCMSLSLEPTHHYLQLQMSASMLRPESCGLNGLLNAQATLSPGSFCEGTLTDFEPVDCAPSSSMVLFFRKCSNSTSQRDVIRREFSCVGFIDIAQGFRLLFTKEQHTSQQARFSCWLIELLNSSSSLHSQWRRAYLLDDSQCAHAPYESLVDPAIYTPIDITFQFQQGSSPNCIEMKGNNLGFTVTGRNKKPQSGASPVSERRHNMGASIKTSLFITSIIAISCILVLEY
ncbi:hypothetical protein CAPTEDRAFT_190800 [Capitella teleta]|uniref:ShKT domain-containing protein n=1 Tax=Capitella teleta TaxID=283909 RepID=R7TWN1_CAPTE|nr:hypothetical protein CAPTEDRAFT_190800 [Capitella teleta]|eukprot:ELT95385.1 hypothetical protein CAPTEDRAFT_190800 [Capitella teleta]